MPGKRLHKVQKEEEKVNRKYIERKLTSNDPKWREIKKAVKENFKGTEKEEFIKLRYEKKMDVIPICIKMSISQTTYYKWREDILNYAMLQAAHKHMINI